MRITLATSTLFTLLAFFALSSAGANSAEASGLSLEAACSALESAPHTGCKIERHSDGAPWLLTTHLVAGRGGKARVAAVETRFCQTVHERGVVGQVQRLSQVGDRRSGGARMEWSCGTPHVSAGPRRSR